MEGRPLGNSGLGAWSVLGREEAGSGEGDNGLPLCPSSARLLARFRALAPHLRHPGLGRVLELQRGAHDRVFVVEEAPPQGWLSSCLSEPTPTLESVLDVGAQVSAALAFLHSLAWRHASSVIHRNLSLENVGVYGWTESGAPLVRLSQYAAFALSDRRRLVQSRIGEGLGLAPEVIVGGSDLPDNSGPKADSWALGILLFQLAKGVDLKKKWTLQQAMGIYASLVARCGGGSILSGLLSAVESEETSEGNTLLQSEPLHSIIRSCLQLEPGNRPLCAEVLEQVQSWTTAPLEENALVVDDVFTVNKRLAHVSIEKYKAFRANCFAAAVDEGKGPPLSWVRRPVEEAYFLWKLAGPSVETIMVRAGLLRQTPAVTAMPDLLDKDGGCRGREAERRQHLRLALFPLALSNLEERLAGLDRAVLLRSPTREEGEEGDETPNLLPTLVKERDIRYQLERLIRFRALLAAHPYQSPVLWKEARLDIPPLYRGHVSDGNETPNLLPTLVKERDIRYQLERLIRFRALLAAHPYQSPVLWKEARLDIPPLYRGHVSDGNETPNLLPTLVKERDIRYQLERLIRFRALLAAHPYQSPVLWKEARLDIPPLYRGHVSDGNETPNLLPTLVKERDIRYQLERLIRFRALLAAHPYQSPVLWKEARLDIPPLYRGHVSDGNETPNLLPTLVKERDIRYQLERLIRFRALLAAHPYQSPVLWKEARLDIPPLYRGHVSDGNETPNLLPTLVKERDIRYQLERLIRFRALLAAHPYQSPVLWKEARLDIPPLYRGHVSDGNETPNLLPTLVKERDIRYQLERLIRFRALLAAHPYQSPVLWKEARLDIPPLYRGHVSDGNETPNLLPTLVKERDIRYQLERLIRFRALLAAHPYQSPVLWKEARLDIPPLYRGHVSDGNETPNLLPTLVKERDIRYQLERLIRFRALLAAHPYQSPVLWKEARLDIPPLYRGHVSDGNETPNLLPTLVKERDIRYQLERLIRFRALLAAHPYQSPVLWKEARLDIPPLYRGHVSDGNETPNLLPTLVKERDIRYQLERLIRFRALLAAHPYQSPVLWKEARLDIPPLYRGHVSDGNETPNLLPTLVKERDIRYQLERLIRFRALLAAHPYQSPVLWKEARLDIPPLYRGHVSDGNETPNLLPTLVKERDIRYQLERLIRFRALLAAHPYQSPVLWKEARLDIPPLYRGHVSDGNETPNLLPTLVKERDIRYQLERLIRFRALLATHPYQSPVLWKEARLDIPPLYRGHVSDGNETPNLLPTLVKERDIRYQLERLIRFRALLAAHPYQSPVLWKEARLDIPPLYRGHVSDGNETPNLLPTLVKERDIRYQLERLIRFRALLAAHPYQSPVLWKEARLDIPPLYRGHVSDGNETPNLLPTLVKERDIRYQLERLIRFRALLAAHPYQSPVLWKEARLDIPPLYRGHVSDGNETPNLLPTLVKERDIRYQLERLIRFRALLAAHPYQSPVLWKEARLDIPPLYRGHVSDGNETPNLLPTLVKERDIRYQLERLIRFRALLAAHPYQSPVLWKEARLDIPPLYRGHVSDGNETPNLLPTLVKERDIRYQLERLIRFRALLAAHPYQSPVLWKEARLDIPPLYRGHVSDGNETPNLLPTLVKERDIRYQLERLIRFRALLAAHPYQSPVLWKEARLDIPPLYRGHVSDGNETPNLLPTLVKERDIRYQLERLIRFRALLATHPYQSPVLWKEARLDIPPLYRGHVSDGNETPNLLPTLVKERDIRYQLERLIRFRALLAAHPYQSPVLWKEARLDIPPLYRGHIWSALLGVEVEAVRRCAEELDVVSQTPTDRQIEVDAPRCHQYDPLMTTPEAQKTLKDLLKAWVNSHPSYVYWQGLDSLAAPFLHLHYANPPLAYASLTAFIPRYLHDFFKHDNSPIIQEYLAVFSHMIAFHDPELALHLKNIDFFPELYAIPWFLTMFAHVFPLGKLYHLWDTVLLGDSSFPLCVGVAVLQQLRPRLLSQGFNESILLFSDLPEVDIERCVEDSVAFHVATPRSVCFRAHAPPGEAARGRPLRSGTFSQPKEDEPGALSRSPLSVSELKGEPCPRLGADELLALSRDKAPLLVMDARPREEFLKGTFPGSISIPWESGATLETHQPNLSHLSAAQAESALFVVLHRNQNIAVSFASVILSRHIRRVCILDGGVGVLRKAGVLTVPPPNIY